MPEIGNVNIWGGGRVRVRGVWEQISGLLILWGQGRGLGDRY